MATIPTIEIKFKQLATTIIQRRERGTTILLLYELDATYGTTAKLLTLLTATGNMLKPM